MFGHCIMAYRASQHILLSLILVLKMPNVSTEYTNALLWKMRMLAVSGAQSATTTLFQNMKDVEGFLMLGTYWT